MRAAIFVLPTLWTAILCSCATTDPQETERLATPAPAALTESLAAEVDRRLGAIESALNQLRPDAAEQALLKLRPLIEDPRLEGYPDTPDLRRRYDEAVGRVPLARGAVAQQALDERAESARAAVSQAQAGLDRDLENIRSGRADELELRRAEEGILATRAALEPGFELESQHIDYSEYTNAVRKGLAEARELIEERRRSIAVEEASDRLTSALDALAACETRLASPEANESDFHAVDAAKTALAEALERGAVTKTLDAEYGKLWQKASRQLEEAPARIASRRLALEVASTKEGIEASRAALAASVRILGQSSSDDADVTETGRLATAVEEKLEAAKELATKDDGFKKYLSDVKRALKETRTSMDKRLFALGVEGAKRRISEMLAELKRALRTLQGETELESATAAIAQLEAALVEARTPARKEASLARLAVDARGALAPARLRITERRAALGADEHKARVKASVATLREALRSLDEHDPSAEAFEAASAAIRATRHDLAEGAQFERKVAAYKSYAGEIRKTLDTAKSRIQQRQAELLVRGQQARVLETLRTARAELKNARTPTASAEDTKRAADAITQLRAQLTKGAQLEAMEKGYAKLAATTRRTAYELKDELELARAAITFRDGPIRVLLEGRARLDVGEQAPEALKKSYVAAIERFTTCRMEAASLLASKPRLSLQTFVVGNKRARGGAVLSDCVALGKVAKEKLTRANAATVARTTAGKDALALNRNGRRARR